MRIKSLLIKYRDLILYGVFGVLTTLVNIVAYWFMAHVLGFKTMPGTVVAWFAAVIFAYLTNRKWVFHSAAVSCADIIKEIISFFLCRLFSGLVDWGCMYIFVDILHFHDVMIKAGANILVIILNYIASKLIIFKSNK